MLPGANEPVASHEAAARLYACWLMMSAPRSLFMIDGSQLIPMIGIATSEHATFCEQPKDAF